MAMKVLVSQQARPEHTATVAALGWTNDNELLSFGDDGALRRWNASGEPMGKLADLGGAFAIDVAFYSAPGGVGPGAASAVAQTFVFATSDGGLVFQTTAGIVERKVDAHQGAALCVRWNHDGSSLLSTGEDGAVKVWSRLGVLRSQLLAADRPVYSAAWSPGSDKALLTMGNALVIKPLNPSEREAKWRAHDGLVLAVDWSPVHEVLVSVGEDRRYKVWDAYARLLHASAPEAFVPTSVAFAPDGELFAVGAYNSLAVCDRAGWIQAREQVDAGSLLRLAWSADATRLAGAGATGAVVFGFISGRRVEWRALEATLVAADKISVYDRAAELSESLEFRDRVVKLSLGFGHLVVATTSQLCVYSAANWATPAIADCPSPVSLLLQAARFFALVDAAGVHIFSYDGRKCASPKVPGLRPELLNRNTVSLCDDTLAIVDRASPNTIALFDASSGRKLDQALVHTADVLVVALSFFGPARERKVAFIDANRELFISPVAKADRVKLATTCESVAWNESTGMLGAVCDGKFVSWAYPSVVYVCRALLARTREVQDIGHFGKAPTILSYCDTHATLRRQDGSMGALVVSPYPQLLLTYADARNWRDALHLCRFVEDPLLWAVFAAIALAAKELAHAVMAFAELEEVDKMKYLSDIVAMPTPERRAAELALFCGRPDEAESMLLQAGMTYYAIELNLRLFRWPRALALARKANTHVDTVLAYRKRYMEDFDREETDEAFLQASAQFDGALDWDAIRRHIAQEEDAERARPGAVPFVSS